VHHLDPEAGHQLDQYRHPGKLSGSMPRIHDRQTRVDGGHGSVVIDIAGDHRLSPGPARRADERTSGPRHHSHAAGTNSGIAREPQPYVTQSLGSPVDEITQAAGPGSDPAD